MTLLDNSNQQEKSKRKEYLLRILNIKYISSSSDTKTHTVTTKIERMEQGYALHW